jgi:oxygen-independent coproporphyrinogen-3 oxidase
MVVPIAPPAATVADVSAPSLVDPGAPASAPNADRAPARPSDPVGIYLHVPFCAHVCPYCDFNTYAGQEGLIPRYVEALRREIAGYAPALAGREVATIFLGGGTPSLLSPAQVGSLLAACRAIAPVQADAEVTLEANPNGIDAPYLAALREAGVNRLSIGAQTLSRRGLRTLGRLHEPEQVAAALTAARQAGFDNVSLDLIFGWPGQTAESWRDDLDRVLGGALGDAAYGEGDGCVPDHLSLYSLIVEPGTPMAEAVARGILVPLDDDAAADRYEAAIERLAEAGWLHYEVANWAAGPGRQSRHNRLYWRNGDYLGLGAGAHGYLHGTRGMNHPLPATYAAAVEAGRTARATEEVIAPRTAMGETMMLGLRLLEDGVAFAAFAARHGVDLDGVFGPDLADLQGRGLLERLPDRVRLTRRGLLLANDVCARFV